MPRTRRASTPAEGDGGSPVEAKAGDVANAGGGGTIKAEEGAGGEPPGEVTAATTGATTPATPQDGTASPSSEVITGGGGGSIRSGRDPPRPSPSPRRSSTEAAGSTRPST
ncbi:hypothetical protein THAOC_08330, partial [Thalassiosira oceanica]